MEGCYQTVPMNMKLFGDYVFADAQDLLNEEFCCDCGKNHSAWPLEYLRIGKGAVSLCPDGLRTLSVKKPYIVMGTNGYRVAGEKVLSDLDAEKIPYKLLVIPADPRILPNEHYTELVEREFEESCDFILGIGSGVINDLCKLVAFRHSLRAGIVATAPSMDGYASNSSAMELGGVKTTVYTVCPSLILCDTEIMRNAPYDMIQSGFGDMAAKIISVADWQIAHLVTGEYYCPHVANMMLRAYREIISNVQGISGRDENAIRIMTEGLVLSGIASSFTGVSRPASGMEHSVSHLLEMFALARGSEPAFHGLQVGYGVRAALELYDMAMKTDSSESKILAAAEQFDEALWEKEMKAVFGEQSDVLIANALREERNSRNSIIRRGRASLSNRKEIRAIMQKVLEQRDELEAALDYMGIADLKAPEELGYTKKEAVNAVLYSKDLRARYIFTSLCSDLGILDREKIEAMIS